MPANDRRQLACLLFIDTLAAQPAAQDDRRQGAVRRDIWIPLMQTRFFQRIIEIGDFLLKSGCGFADVMQTGQQRHHPPRRRFIQTEHRYQPVFLAGAKHIVPHAISNRRHIQQVINQQMISAGWVFRPASWIALRPQKIQRRFRFGAAVECQTIIPNLTFEAADDALTQVLWLFDNHARTPTPNPRHQLLRLGNLNCVDDIPVGGGVDLL